VNTNNASSLVPKADALAARLSGAAKPSAALPPAPAAQDDVRARAAQASRSHSEARPQEVQSTDEDDAAALEQDSEDTATTGDTLAHWLLNQGAYVADPAQAGQGRAGGLPPPQNAAAASDDLKAAAMAREVLDAVRSRAKAASAGKPGAAGAGADAGADAAEADATRRDGGREKKAGQSDSLLPGMLPTASAEAAVAPAVHREEPAARFDEQLAAALQAPLPAPAAATPMGMAGTGTPAAVGAERQIDTPVDHPGFGEAVGVTISQMARNGVHEARLQLNPAELGPVSVHIAMNGQEARIDLGAAHAQTRAMLDASLPALTEAFRADGLVLAASQVSDWQDPRAGAATTGNPGGMTSGQGQGQPGTGGSWAGPSGTPQRAGWVGRADAGDVPLPAPTTWGGRGLGGLDLYA
jgi:flagellar hook-length control protein FliK